jgi:hypothetical protein
MHAVLTVNQCRVLMKCAIAAAAAAAAAACHPPSGSSSALTSTVSLNRNPEACYNSAWYLCTQHVVHSKHTKLQRLGLRLHEAHESARWDRVQEPDSPVHDGFTLGMQR